MRQRSAIDQDILIYVATSTISSVGLNGEEISHEQLSNLNWPEGPEDILLSKL
jgi:hypothetical protein